MGSAKQGRTKRILEYSFDNGWDELDHARVQPSSHSGLEIRPRILSIQKTENVPYLVVNNDILLQFASQVVQQHSDYLEIGNVVDGKFINFNRKSPLECPFCKRIHDKPQRCYGFIRSCDNKFTVKCFRQSKDEAGKVFEGNSSMIEKFEQAPCINTNDHLSSTTKGPKRFLDMPSWANINEPLTTTEVYEDRLVRFLPEENDVYVSAYWGEVSPNHLNG